MKQTNQNQYKFSLTLVVIVVFLIVASTAVSLKLTSNPYQEIDPLFSLKDTTKTVNPREKVYSSSEIKTMPLDVKLPKQVSGVSLSGTVKTFNSKGFARVVITDNNGDEWLVFGSDFLFLDDKIFQNVCEETCALPPTKIKDIRVEVSNAKITIDGIHFSDKQSKSLRSQQHERKLELVNEYVNENNFDWIAGDTEVSKKLYRELKELQYEDDVLRIPYDLFFYTGGVYSYDGDGGEPAPDVYPAIDYRNYMGKNWMTNVKDQGGCGSCWAFSTNGALEAVFNTYYNDISNLDLSEQQLVSTGTGKGGICCDNCGTCQAGWVSNSMVFLRDHGLITEACYPYAGQDEQCEIPEECGRNPRHMISYAFVTPNTPQEMLFKNGPGTVRVLSWAHAMVTAGYSEPNTLIIKNSWGVNWGDEGYLTMEYDHLDMILMWINEPYRTVKPLSVLCKNEDNDQYCYWGKNGLPKPSNCPSSCPMTQPDCDDSNQKLGAYLSPTNFNCQKQSIGGIK